MKKTYILILIASILGIASMYLLKNNKGAATSLTSTDKDFAIKNFDEVFKIFLADRKGHKILLERKDKDNWTLNGKFDVRPDAMLMMRQVMTYVSIKTVPTNSAMSGIISDLATQGIKVEAYNQKNELIKSYIVGGANKDESGTYMIMDGAEQPYLTYIEMLPGGLRTRYMVNEDDWKDRRFFKEPIENIKQVVVEYPSLQSKSFKLIHDGSNFTIQPLMSNMPKSANPIKRGIAEKYLDQFKGIGAEAFRTSMVEKDSIIANLRPFATIKMTNIQNKETSISLYPIEKEEMTAEEREKNIGKSIERYFGNCSNGEFYLLQQVVIGKLLWSYDSFFTENKTE
ncbi:MAG: hypothetical protein IPL95_15930 [Saprospiraceae bacterium]|nr:hypothetical protein [Saprospiraceae bacterium]